jgi:hypothetical protein
MDVSSTIGRLTRERLRRWPAHTEMRVSDGSTKLEVPDGSFDRFVTNYVLDLLREANMSSMLAEAARLLTDDGLLCLVSLTHGDKSFSKLVLLAWERVHAFRPLLVGGCRPISLLNFQLANQHREVVSVFGISSEAICGGPNDQLSGAEVRLLISAHLCTYI